MSPRHSQDDLPTTVQQQTAVQPAVAAVPATRHSRLFPGGRLPARIGRARTSTLALGLLFVLLFALYVAVRPDPVEYTTVTTTSGQTLRVPASDVLPPPTSPVPGPESTPAQTPDPAAPTSDPADTTSTEPTAPTTTGRQTPTTAAPPTDDEEESTTSAPPRSRATTSAPAPTSDAPAETAEPTG
ncbi:hypothetical protein [Modestobacter sp. I12A-02662]|uniref:hypothetical protein n=1 Tax=Modestobacter sp. I12A-02662 TaxID=1730496 RepID=UPI0034DE6E91